MSDPRTTRTQDGVRRLYEYLLSIKKEPAKHLGDERLQAALTSQGSLARFNMPEVGITSMSLNTAKRAASAVFEDGGYTKIDRLRRDCAQAINAVKTASSASSARETKTSLRMRAEAAEQQIALLSEDLQIVSSLFQECLRQARAYADRADAATQTRCKKEQRDLLQMLGLLRGE